MNKPSWLEGLPSRELHLTDLSTISFVDGIRKVLELGKPVQTADKNECNFLFVPALKLGTGHHPHTINKLDFLSETERSISLG